MANETFFVFVTIGVIVGALSMVLQVLLIFGVYKSVKATGERVNHLSDRAEPVLEAARKTIEENRPKINEMTSQALEMMATAKQQVAKLDALLDETTDRARVQVERLDLALSDAVDKVQETAAAVQHSILKPVREVSGVVSGVRAAISTLKKGSRASVDHATQDEEMFI